MRISNELERKAFTRGFAMACANIARDHGEDTLAEYLLEAAGYTLADLRACGLEPYDLRVLAPIMEAVAKRETSTPEPSRSGPLKPGSTDENPS